MTQNTVRLYVNAFCEIGLVSKQSRTGKGGRQTANLYCIDTDKIGHDTISADVFNAIRPPSRRTKTREAENLATNGRGCRQQSLPPLPKAEPPPSARNTSPFFNRLEEPSSSTADTGKAGACAFVSPPGAAAPEPPLAPPARTQSVPDVDDAPLDEPEAKPEVTSFRQAQAVLQAAKGEPVKEKLQRVVPYGERTRLALDYLLIWQAECEDRDQTYRFSEAHWLQSGELADREEVPLTVFCINLRAAWEAKPCAGYDPLFMCSHHSRKLTCFLKHFRRMADELDQQED